MDRNVALNSQVTNHERITGEPSLSGVTTGGEQRVLLHNVRWETYENILHDHLDSSAPRFTFDHGELEIMSPSAEHERYNWQIAQLVVVLAAELDLELAPFGSTTFQREDLRRGFEADACFYFNGVGQMLGKDQLDMTVDPPPDLVIEIDITSPALPKLPIFAQFGVPEVWRFKGGRLSIFILEGGTYRETEQSTVFPGLSSASISELVKQGKRLGVTAWGKRVRAWAHEHYAK